eukprot:m.457864 g.457864  ORF g.457864 m.457864 type:complete len:226 (-) comp21363_c0_seq1:97-774(-)
MPKRNRLRGLARIWDHRRFLPASPAPADRTTSIGVESNNWTSTQMPSDAEDLDSTDAPQSPGVLSTRTKSCRECHGAVEVGTVRWGRDLDAALASAASGGPPVFALFQEVPGCAGCQKFGREVLSDPTISAAIEAAFNPILIYNNRGGKDAKLLKRFREPAWNYQVVRFLGGDGSDILPRQDRVWTRTELAVRMVAALEKAKRSVPGYLRTVIDSPADSLDTAFV